MRLRNALRVRRTASAFCRARRSDGFSYARRRFISRNVPSRCFFFVSGGGGVLVWLSGKKPCINFSSTGSPRKGAGGMGGVAARRSDDRQLVRELQLVGGLLAALGDDLEADLLS